MEPQARPLVIMEFKRVKSIFGKFAKLNGPAKFIVAVTIAFICFVGIIASGIGIFLLTTPRPTNIRECFTTELFKVHLCPTSPDYTKLKNISPYLRAAVIVSEDSNFYNHKGIDWFEVRESINKNLEKGEYVRGGSTITQQLAKNLYLTAEKSIFRKIREAIIAVQIETILTKDEILEKYLNVVEFGKDIYGVRKAASYYFNKLPSQLSVAESAFLAFLLPNPKNYSVSFRRKKLTPFARARMKLIVNRMWTLKKIDGYEYDIAMAEIDSFFQPKPEPQPEAEDLGIDGLLEQPELATESSPSDEIPADAPAVPETSTLEDLPLPDPEEAGDGEDVAD